MRVRDLYCAATVAAALLAAPAGATGPMPDDGLRAARAFALEPELAVRWSRLPLAASPARERDAARRSSLICSLIETSAEAHGMPPAFFARLIWKESRFDEKAISPVGAQGIAQFMPGTAKLVGLADPWDPAQAIPASAKHLADLRAEFGNLGLAAAAYNAGGGRVWRWLSGRSGLPGETVDYVYSITARPADWFRVREREHEAKPLHPELGFDEACRKLPIMKTRALHAGGPLKPWGAAVAGNTRRGAALSQFSRAQNRYRSILGGLSPQVVPQRRARGLRPIYSVQVGADSRAEAARICARMQGAGGSCVVQRN